MNIKEIIESLASRVSIVEQVGKAPILVSPNEYKVTSLEQHLAAPTRTRKLVTFVEKQSFLEYYEKFSLDNSLIFCKRTSAGMSFKAVFDYDTKDAPSWCGHSAVLNMSYHPDYLLMLEHNDNWFEQEEFALFVEGNTHLFLDPSGADMLELAQDLKGSKTGEFVSGKRLANGRVHLEYVEQVKASGVRSGLDVPETIKLLLPIFEGQKPVEVKAALRWRENQGKVKFSYRMLSVLEERMSVEAVRMDIEAASKKSTLQVDSFTD